MRCHHPCAQRLKRGAQFAFVGGTISVLMLRFDRSGDERGLKVKPDARLAPIIFFVKFLLAISSTHSYHSLSHALALGTMFPSFALSPSYSSRPEDAEIELCTPGEEAELSRLWQKFDETSRRFVTAKLEGKTNKEAVAYAAQGKNKKQLENRFSHNPSIIRYLYIATRSAVRKTLVTRNDVVNGLLDAVEAAGSSADLTAAWREIGKLIGAYEPEKINVTLDASDLTVDQLATLSTRELIEMTKKGDLFEVDADQDFAREEYARITQVIEPHKPLAVLEAPQPEVDTDGR